MKKIGIITALTLEGEQIEKILGSPAEIDLYGRFSIKTYRLNDKIIYCANCGVGEIAAASCTQILISVYNAEMVLNYGFAGGYGSFNQGDGIIASGVVHYDFDVSEVDGCKPYLYPELFDSPVIPVDRHLVRLAEKECADFKTGVLASGDKFVTDKAFKDEMNEKFGAVAFDMEGAGVLLTCKNSGTPALIIKVISDSGNADEYYSFKDLVRRTKIKFAKLLQKLTLVL